jgi:hypothetical protein
VIGALRDVGKLPASPSAAAAVKKASTQKAPKVATETKLPAAKETATHAETTAAT